MKFVTFRTTEGLKVGVSTESGVVQVEEPIESILAGGSQMLQTVAAKVQQVLESGNCIPFKEEELILGPCVPNPGKIICVGLNYRKHAEESNMPIPQFPILFNKFNNCLAAHGEEIPLPLESEQVDYEAELAIVIGKTAKRVTREEALEFVFGYCAANDLSARDLQFRTNQWLLGKCCDGFAPLGPCLVTAEEVGNPNDLGIRTYVNDEIRQNSNTADMVFHCDELISYISHYVTLEPGDVILTGTPEGVIMGYPKDKQVWLKDGDVVTIEIDRLGRLTNLMRRG
ncbi:fumarylacetoacetate hydrolase family protein [Effusibacillus lacus]|uniref:5-carboxymethyl-2-hydroxymuconate isomerase n=1 Tax=Effusibacillus lacus TaxID=1348429 RepID=A0A292YJ78_9BACL|nr:fumarylacetoacetate hydrolase family protein [Effusibacillus lacus]TCS68588.1 2-keto-4-pentenoate hydratase/2-oxohepta-3-ene-1,7-dioic acid hydratase in catechol pathway [Effusibacillus lacus]GAX88823.1 5-carboxymethyl-2-hydroxymuconate isomerase [Effusibacillus lacus]